MQCGSGGVRRGRFALVGMAEGILFVAEGDIVAVVNNGSGCYRDQVDTGFGVEAQCNIQSLDWGHIHRSLAVAVAVVVVVVAVDLAGTPEGHHHNIHLLP